MFFDFWVPCEILRITNIELASFIPSSLHIIIYPFSIIFPTSSHHRGTRSAQRACPRAKNKLFDPSADGELFVF
jgi:hypothetical protein